MDYPQLADKRAYIAAVIQEIFEKGIRRRVKIKNVSVFNQVRDYVINNFGSTTSLVNIQSDLESKQVAMTIMADRSTEEREYRPFEQIRDNCPKYLLTRSDPIQQRDGIIHANIPSSCRKGGPSERDGDWLSTGGAIDGGVGLK